MFSVGQLIRCKNSWGKWEKTSLIKIEELDGVPFKWYCANGISTCRPDWDFDWKDKPRMKTLPPYKPRHWDKGTKVKFMPYSTMSFKLMAGVIEDDFGDGFVLVKMDSGQKTKIPERNIR